MCTWKKKKTNHSMVMICLLGVPLNSSFIRCSKIQTTVPTTRKKKAVTAHNVGENGRKKAQAPVFIFLNGATTTSPDAAYGCVKSTILVRFVTIAISPTAPSNTYNKSLIFKASVCYELFRHCLGHFSYAWYVVTVLCLTCIGLRLWLMSMGQKL